MVISSNRILSISLLLYSFAYTSLDGDKRNISSVSSLFADEADEAWRHVCCGVSLQQASPFYTSKLTRLDSCCRYGKRRDIPGFGEG